MTHESSVDSPLMLRQLFPSARFTGARDIPVHACCSDADRCQPGDLYVALLDSHRDGHDDLSRAISRGAAAVLVERHVISPVPTCQVTDTRDALGILCHHLAGKPSSQLSVAGITGTSGKTATTHLLQSIWKKASIQSGLVSSVCHDDGHQVMPSCHDTPSPPELADLMARMTQHECQRVDLEISSRALAARQLAGIELDAAIITRIRSDHLDLHGSLENYRRAKLQILSLLKPAGLAIVNLDDPATRTLLPMIDVPLLTFGIHSDADITGTVLQRNPNEQVFLITAGQETAVVRSGVIGNPHVAHCLAAAALGLASGVELATIAAGLSTPHRVPGHLERVECGQPFSVYVDSANHPDTIAMALNAIRLSTTGRLICVFGPSGHRSAELRARMGCVVERSADLGIITSHDTRERAPLARSHDVLDGYEQPGQAHIIPDRVEAVCWALDQAGAGDAVLIAGNEIQTIHEQGLTLDNFDDFQVVTEWLHQRSRSPVFPRIYPPSLTSPHDVN